MSSIIPWRGGKHLLARKIVTHFPKHLTYVEPFMGACHVLFAKRAETSEHEVINDLQGELVNAFAQIRDRPDELIRAFEWDLTSRQEYDRHRSTDPTTLDPIARAHRFIYMMRTCFGGSYGEVFGTHRTCAKSLRPDLIPHKLRTIHRRLQNVTIECRDYTALTKTYDAPETLWYLDPPYFGARTKGYAESLDPDKFVAFVGSLKGKVVISHRPSAQFDSNFQGPGWRTVILGERRVDINSHVESRANTYTELLWIRD